MDMITMAAVAAGTGGVGFVVGFLINKQLANVKGQNADEIAIKIKQEADKASKQMIRDAEKESEHIMREAKISAKDELLKIKDDFEKEMKPRKQELASQENRLIQKENNLEKKSDSIDDKVKDLERKNKEITSIKERLTVKEEDIKATIQKQIDELEKIAHLSRDEAQKIILEKLEGEIQNETGMVIKNILEEKKEKLERDARDMITSAIQRYAADCTYERTTATIPLPSDEMKGRIIGREGRNIRALEAATGVSLLIDDTPEAVVISCFDPIRKEVARILLERLVSDGRIHPTRIEDLIKKIRKEVEDEAFAAGEDAILELGIHGIAPPIVKLIGRLKYRFSYSQNVLRHSLETAFFMGSIACELGLDEQKAKRIGLLHDIGKAVTHEVEGSHAIIGAEILTKHGEPKDIVNAVAAHHGEVDPETPYAVLADACDALSASRPGARSATTELYLKRLEDLEDIAAGFEGVETAFALQAGREIRVVVSPDKINEEKAHTLARDICLGIEKQMTYPGQIKVTIIRETRSVEYAK